METLKLQFFILKLGVNTVMKLVKALNINLLSARQLEPRLILVAPNKAEVFVFFAVGNLKI